MIKILGYIWMMIIGVLTVSIVVGIFSLASSRFETAVLAILVLIYLSIEVNSDQWALVYSEFSGNLERKFQELDHLLDKDYKDAIKRYNRNPYNELKSPQEVADDYKKDVDVERKEAQKEKIKSERHMTIKYYIGQLFRLIIYLIALYNLLLALGVFQ